MKSIAQCLGLAAEATEEQITAKCKELLTAAAEAPPLRAAVAAFAAEVKDDGLKALAATGQVELISAGLKTAALKLQNPPGMVAKADYEALAAQVKTLQDEQARQQCSALIAAHAQQLPPAKEEWFRKFYAADPVAAKEWIEQAPELVSRQPAAGTTTPGAGGDRQALITSARAKVRAEPGVLWGGRTEREFVNGQLLAGGQKGLTDDEAVKLGL